MKRTYFALLTGVLLLTLQPASAQVERTRSEAATLEQRLAEDLGVENINALFATRGAPSIISPLNNAKLLQNGNGNRAATTQGNTGTILNDAFIEQIGNGNQMDLMQVGSKNTAHFTQQGNDNKSILSQDGFDNKISGLVYGSKNEVNAVQKGNQNEIIGDIHDNGKKYTMTQTGNNNTLTQFESSSQINGYRVDMKGNGIILKIEQGNIVR